MKKTIPLLLILLFMFVGLVRAQDDVSYQPFDTDGNQLTWSDVAMRLQMYDVILVGETHNDSIGHVVELELLKTIAADTSRTSVAVSMEMFERDVQYIVDEYMDDQIVESHFKKSARAWDNYDTDYKPIVDFARENGLPLIAANSPRRYVNRVTRYGPEALDTLPPSAKKFLPPLPVAPPTDAYSAKWDKEMAEAMQHMTPDTTAAAPEPESEPDSDEEMADDSTDTEDYAAHGGFSLRRMLEAQNVWDAGMAYSIASHMTTVPGSSVVHYVGSFHVESRSGLPDHVQRYRPSARVGVVFLAPVANAAEFDSDLKGTGDIIIQTLSPGSE
ncbi:MAG: ChaN family lipoprotein [Rhodothermales bacterium]|nr:ChaN family lipoprotein [Rhodothermales bacterium]